MKTSIILWAAAWVLLLPRLVLAVLVFVLLTLVPYGSGEGYTAVSLVPRTAVGSSVPTLNNVIVWVAGICTLLLTVWYVPRAVLAFLLVAWLVMEGVKAGGALGSSAQFGAIASGGWIPLLNALVAIKVTLGSWAMVQLLVRYRGLF